jgi:hypothetical protein
MVTGEIRSQVDQIWDNFWTGGISNPLEVIEQFTYLLFVRQLDELHTLEERKAARLKKPMECRIFPEGQDEKGRSYEDLRWSKFKNFAPAEMFGVVGEHVFPFLRTLGGDGSTHGDHMRDARFTIPTPALLAKVVDGIDQVPMEDRDTKGALYEYMQGKIATAGQNGEFYTPQHVIELMVEMIAPPPKDVIVGGTAGFLAAAGEYPRQRRTRKGNGLTVYIANFGQGNYLWLKCLSRNTIATIDNVSAHPFWEARDHTGFVDYAVKHLKTAQNERPTKSVASRWYGINDVVAETAGDLWIHREKDQLWWAISRDDPVDITLEDAVFSDRDGPKIYELHKPSNPWSNHNQKGARLLWNALHPKAKDFLFTEGTLQQLTLENAEYAHALIAGGDLGPWHRQKSWLAKEQRTKKSPATTYDARRRAVWRMADTVANTVAGSNGQQVPRTVKDKRSAFNKEVLMDYVSNLLENQDGLCAVSGIKLQLDGEEDDKELLCSLDRIDSHGHYEPGNLQVVCRFVNRWKGASPDADFRRLIQLVQSSRF